MSLKLYVWYDGPEVYLAIASTLEEAVNIIVETCPDLPAWDNPEDRREWLMSNVETEFILNRPRFLSRLQPY